MEIGDGDKEMKGEERNLRRRAARQVKNRMSGWPRGGKTSFGNPSFLLASYTSKILRKRFRNAGRLITLCTCLHERDREVLFTD